LECGAPAPLSEPPEAACGLLALCDSIGRAAGGRSKLP